MVDLALTCCPVMQLPCNRSCVCRWSAAPPLCCSPQVRYGQWNVATAASPSPRSVGALLRASCCGASWTGGEAQDNLIHLLSHLLCLPLWCVNTFNDH